MNRRTRTILLPSFISLLFLTRFVPPPLLMRDTRTADVVFLSLI
jgi:hypothetical protein